MYGKNKSRDIPFPEARPLWWKCNFFMDPAKKNQNAAALCSYVNYAIPIQQVALMMLHEL